MYTLILADDDASVREVLREFIESCCPDIKVIAEAANGEEAVMLARKMLPNIALIDVRMPVMDGIEATRKIKRVYCLDTVVICFTSYSLGKLKDEAIEAGASIYLQKPFDLDDVNKALNQAMLIYGRG
jgi:YesN/AraC family two-component response regulator